MSVPKKRNQGKLSPSTLDVDDPSLKYTKDTPKCEQIAEHWLLQPLPEPEFRYNFWVIVVTSLAFAARFYKIWYPKEVVFDEVHFGKFASYYLERSYFFDVHPPFAKMMIAFIGWLCGYDGSFKFDEIGYSYETHPAPYIAYRSFNAILGSLTVSIMFHTLKELNFRAITCAFASLLVAIDTAHVTETRLILLDAILIISIAATMYCYVRFYKCQLRQPFTWSWYIWLHATGLSLSFVISTKYVGVMTYAAIGFAVVVNLWQLLDIKAGLSLRLFMRHFSKRLNGLVLIPFVVYLFWFWVHFTILNTSGPGDAFMSAEFQETLKDSPLSVDSKTVNYFDIITIKHQDTGAFLHSHLARYPQRYEDGRISSAGQQVTGYAHPDFNNQWEVLPPHDSDVGKGQAVLLNQHIRLRHVATDTYLLAHDVASPFYPTNEEITTVSLEEGDGEVYAETLFAFQPLKRSDEGHILKSKTVSFRLFHIDTSVALWTHNDELLPDWGFQQQEVNGNKKVIDPSNNWVVEEIVNLDEARKVYIPKVVKSLPFLKKWIETQKSMFDHNNKLSSEHPFASEPYSWPGSLSGVSFWTNGDEKKQIYFIGNIIGWWFQVISLAVFVGIVIADLISRHRGYYALNKMTREKLYGPLMFFFISWCCHYFPFFLMARQKFLHHYLPAHLIACLFSGALWEVIFSDCKSLNLEKDEEVSGTPYQKNPKIYAKPYMAFLICVSAATAWFFVYFSPLVYGDVSLSPSEVISREWFDIELNFSK